MNARFWIWCNGDWVKLTMRPGQHFAFSKGAATDEGFSCEAEVYDFDGDFVEYQISTWGRDCDGGHEWTGRGQCHVSALRDNEADEYGPARPTWEKGASSQRDEYAELAGY